VTRWTIGVAASLVAVLGTTARVDGQAGVSSRSARPAGQSVAPSPGAGFVDTYCVSCHNARAMAGGVSLEGLDSLAPAPHAELWEKVIRKVSTGLMPPDAARQPSAEARAMFVLGLERRLDAGARSKPDPGMPALHRLNRAEYANAIRDLLALEVDITALLPPDDSAAGFDNNADVLGVSPALISGYASAAARLSRLAVGDPSIGVDRAVYRVPTDLVQDAHIDGLPLGTRGGMVVRHTFPLDAEYDVEVGAGGPPALGAARAGGPRGGGGPPADDRFVTLDGEPVALQPRGPTRLRVTAGPHTLAVAMRVRSRVTGADSVFQAVGRQPGISQVVIAGPFNPTGPGESPSRRRLLVCQPTSPATEFSCARTILNTLATRAYRRPVPMRGQEMNTLLGFYRAGRDGGTFESGVQRAVARVLVDPQFLFRFEKEPADVAPGRAFRLSALELASRLSFFLWSTIPDDALLADARRGTLTRPAVLERQVRRMLADPKADAFVANFAGQWLLLRELRNVRPDSPAWDGNLRQSMQRETEMVFRAIVQEDRPVTDLLDADFTFVDERLARHYGMPNVRGSLMRRVGLPADDPRRGLLGQASILTVTSAANRTSPVTRGKWVLENVLGAPPPQPPPGVETNLEKDAVEVKTTTLRQRMERHRSNAVCASCHRLMDPIGFSLENFDHTGRWRTMDGTAPIDATGQLLGIGRLDGPATLRQALLVKSDVFANVFSERLLTYAVGRAMRPQDMPAVRAVTRAGAAGRYRFSSLVLGVVRSPVFQMRTKSAPAVD
jgi:cytochrome c553